MDTLWYAVGAFCLGTLVGALGMRSYIRWWIQHRLPGVMEQAFNEALDEYLEEQGETVSSPRPCRCRPIRRNGKVS